MKLLTLLISLSCGLAACGKEDSTTDKLTMDKNLVGTWSSTSTSELMIISPDGTVSSSICGSYKIIEVNQDTLANCNAGASPGPGVTIRSCGRGKITVTGATGANNCLTDGSHSCVYLTSFTTSNSYLSYRCDGGTIIFYTRQ